MANKRLGGGKRAVPRTSSGTVGGRRTTTGGGTGKRSGSGLGGFKQTRNSPRPNWGK